MKTISLAILVLLLAGCSAKLGAFKGAITCINVTTPMFSWECSEVGAPPVPNGQPAP